MYVLKNIEIETLFKFNTDINNKWNINFIQSSLLGVHNTYSSEFFIVRSTFKIPFVMV